MTGVVDDYGVSALTAPIELRGRITSAPNIDRRPGHNQSAFVSWIAFTLKVDTVLQTGGAHARQWLPSGLSTVTVRRHDDRGRQEAERIFTEHIEQGRWSSGSLVEVRGTVGHGTWIRPDGSLGVRSWVDLDTLVAL